MVIITVEERELPKIASGSFVLSATPTKSGSSHTSQKLRMATITPPSAVGNPNVWRSNHLPDGLIYIIVGAIVGAIFFFIIVWYAVSRYISRKIAKRTMYENGVQWRDTPSGGLYEHGDEKELYESLMDHHSDKEGLRRKRSLIGLLGGNGDPSYETLADTDNTVDDDLMGGAYQERLNAVQDLVPNHFPRSSLFISPTMEVIQQKQQQQRLNYLQNPSVTSISSTSESANNNLGKPERTASPERKPKVYGRYHRKNKSSTSSLDIANINNAVTTAPSKFLNNLLEGKDEPI